MNEKKEKKKKDQNVTKRPFLRHGTDQTQCSRLLNFGPSWEKWDFFLPGPRGRSGWKVKFSSRLWGLVAGEEQASSKHALAELIQGLKRYKNRVLSDPRLVYDWLKPSCCLWSYVQITYSHMSYVLCCYKCWSCKLPVNLNLCWASQPRSVQISTGHGNSEVL